MVCDAERRNDVLKGIVEVLEEVVGGRARRGPSAGGPMLIKHDLIFRETTASLRRVVSFPRTSRRPVYHQQQQT